MTTHPEVSVGAPFVVQNDVPSPHSLGNRIGRLLWNTLGRTVFRLIPSPFHGPRILILRLFGAEVAFDAHVHPSVKIWAPWNLRMDHQACLGPGVICYNVGIISLGRCATVSQYAHLCAATHDYRHPAMPLMHAPIRIDEGAWICADAFVHMGVTIGRNTVIAARAVVTESMPDGMICGGHPCVALKPRIPDVVPLTHEDE